MTGARKVKIQPIVITKTDFKKFSEEEKMSTQDVADLFEFEKTTISNWRYQGEGPVFYKVGRGNTSRVFYLKSDVMKFKSFFKYIPAGRPSKDVDIEKVLKCLDWNDSIESAAGMVLIECVNKRKAG